MKHLLKFNEAYNNDHTFEKMDRNQFINWKSSHKILTILNKDQLKIDNIISDLKLNISLSTYIGLSKVYILNGKTINIEKFEDSWFSVCANEYTGGIYYICDEFEGIKDSLSSHFNI